MSAEPTPDEREALRRIIDLALYQALGNAFSDAVMERVVDQVQRAIEGAGFHRQGPVTDDTEWEYGWSSRFENGEEYEWLACSDREEAEYQIREYQAEEDREVTDGHLTYILQRRRAAKAGPWEPVEATQEGTDQ